jgi:superfamily I DNA/RNA helicase
VLTDAQAKIVELSPASRTLVVAGPGTGKTHVLIHRLAHLIDDGLSPAQQVLVLSFTRAAVKNIKDRLRLMTGDVGYVRATTFDSFAARLLRSIAADLAWNEHSYDAAIEAATRAVASDVDLDEISDVKHVLVDEVQDLVGIRLEFVRAILERTNCGFTIFGDPAQGIYEYQQALDSRQRAGPSEFFAWLRERYNGQLTEVVLYENFRAKTKDARIALWAGQSLAEAGPDCESVWDRLIKELGTVQTLGSPETAARFLGRVHNHTAVLCRDNGQALLLSRLLFKHGIPHIVQRGAKDRAVAPWVAVLFRGYDEPSMSRNVFSRRLQMVTDSPDEASAWQLLKRLDRQRGDQLRMSAVRNAIATNDVPDDLLSQATGQLTISSIHRAKGLEFHTVILMEPSLRLDDDWGQCEEARVLFVGLTRTSHQLLHLAAPDTRGMSSRKNPEGRWVRRKPFGNGAYMTLDFEVRGSDADRERPSLVVGREGSKATEELQEYLSSSVRIGDPLTLSLIPALAPGESRPRFSVKHGDRVVGITTPTFTNCLLGSLRISRTSRLPDLIEDLHVECVDTVAGDPGASRSQGLGSAGLWLRCRPFGLGDLKYIK